MRKSLLGLVLIAGCATPALAGDFGIKDAKIGRWQVYVDSNSMTDAKECTALFDDRAAVQLTPRSLGINMRGRGGVQAYQLRLDDSVPQELKLVSDDEKSISAMVLTRDDNAPLFRARRARLQIFTVLETVVEEDIDLAASPDIQKRFAALGC